MEYLTPRQKRLQQTKTESKKADTYLTPRQKRLQEEPSKKEAFSAAKSEPTKSNKTNLAMLNRVTDEDKKQTEPPKSKNWVEEIQSGNIGKGLLKLGGATLNAPKDLLMNTSKNIVNVAKGDKLEYKQDYDYSKYIKDVSGKDVDNIKNPLVRNFTKSSLELVSDPLSYWGGGVIDDFANAGKVGKKSVQGTEKLILEGNKNNLALGKAKDISKTRALEKTIEESAPTLDTVPEKVKYAAEAMEKDLSINVPIPKKTVSKAEINAVDSVKNERGFAVNAKGSKDITDNVMNELNAKRLTYEPISEATTLSKAKSIVDADPDKAFTDVLTGTGKGITRDEVATGELLIKKAFESGEDKKAYTLISHIAEKLTESGQAIQAAAMFKRMTPEGMLMYAEKIVKKANKEIDSSVKDGGFIDPLKKFYKKGNLTDEMKGKIKSDMEEAMKLPEGREKSEKMAKIMQTISDAMPKSPFGKAESLRTIMMLSNPKTWIRNFVSNAAFGAVEATATKPLATLIDKGLKLKTGQRTVANTNLKELGKGFVEGGKNAISDVKKGIDTSPTRGMLEVPRANEFADIPVLAQIEKAVKLGVSGGDRPFYEAAYKDAIAEQLKIHEINTGKKLAEATTEMKAAADELAKYRTYADNNMLSNSLSKVKSGLNKFRVGGIGAGDVLMKFTKTPANLVARGIDYSPAGLVKGIVDVSRVLGGNSEIQRQAAQGLARGVIGTTFVSGAILLTNFGILRGEKSKSNSANAFEQAIGKGQYTLNTSALKRFIASGLDPDSAKEKPGDKIATYDWAQPLALSTAVGANIGESLQRKQKVDPLGILGTVIGSLESGANTIIEQPMLQNINKVFKGDNPVQGLMSVIQDYPASFVPAFLQGMRYAADPYIRDTSGNFVEGIGKKIINKLPGISRNLDKTSDVLGNDRKVTASNPITRLLDSALNPTRSTKVTDNKTTLEINRLYKQSNDGYILPNLVEKSDTIPSIKKGEPPKELTSKQRTEYQKLLAESYLTRANSLVNSPDWKTLSEESKIKRLEKARNKSYDLAKKKMQSIIFGK